MAIMIFMVAILFFMKAIMNFIPALLIFIPLRLTTNRAIAFSQGGEESLDSIGQCTGEEPGLFCKEGNRQCHRKLQPSPTEALALVGSSKFRKGNLLSLEGDGENVG
jgi:hypothetical protein